MPQSYKHIVCDDALHPAIVRAACAAWPADTDPIWFRYASGKYGSRDRQVPAAAWQCVLDIARHPAIQAEWPDVFPDLSLHAAGLHMSPRGTTLGLHRDADHHNVTGWQRRLSAVLFLNTEWSANAGGVLQLHTDQDATNTVAIQPQFNRLAVFECTDTSWHSVSEVTHDEPRKTISLFFYDATPAPRTRPQAEFQGQSHV